MVTRLKKVCFEDVTMSFGDSMMRCPVFMIKTETIFVVLPHCMVIFVAVRTIGFGTDKIFKLF